MAFFRYAICRFAMLTAGLPLLVRAIYNIVVATPLSLSLSISLYATPIIFSLSLLRFASRHSQRHCLIRAAIRY